MAFQCSVTIIYGLGFFPQDPTENAQDHDKNRNAYEVPFRILMYQDVAMAP